MRPTHLSLFTGIGGIDLAAEWAGFRTVAMCEKDPYCRRVLAKHWPGVPCAEDVHDLDGAAYGPIDLLTGGFPCQPFSLAGKRRGTGDDRHLWPAMLGVIRQARPAWVVGENVAGFVPMALDLVSADLEGEGYEVQSFVFPACGVGAPHQRQRCFVVAHATGCGRHEPQIAPAGQYQERQSARAAGRSGGVAALAHAERPRLALGQGVGGHARPQLTAIERGGGPAGGDWWLLEPPVGRVVDGLPGRVDRLRALGNAVVPQQVYPLLQGIYDLIMEGA